MAQTPTIDGQVDWSYGAPKVWQLVQTSYGNNTLTDGKYADGSELNAAYGVISGGRLYVTLTGNLQSNNNRLFIFIDSVSGGQNRLRGDNSGNATLLRLGDSGGSNGFTFESGFDADYALALNGNYDAVPNDYRLYADFSNLPTSSGGTSTFLGAAAAQSSGSLLGGVNLIDVRATIDNGSTAGVAGGTTAGVNPGNTTKGVEFSIPLASIGNPTGPIKIFAMITSGDGSNVSNQMLPSVGYAGGTVASYGEPRGQNLAGTTGSNQGIQYFFVEPLQSGRLAVLRHGSGSGAIQNPAPLYVEEYATSGGSSLRTVSIPSTGGTRFVHGNASTVESQLVRSADGMMLTFAGYDQAPNGSLTGVGRRLGYLDRTGSSAIFGTIVSTSDTLRSTTTFDGSRAYMGTNSGSYNIVFGASSGNFVSSTNCRGINIFNGQLHQAAQTTLSTVGVGLPTTSFTAAALPGMSTTLNDAADFAYGDPATLYVADNGAGTGGVGGGIQKWTNNGTTWSRAYIIAPPSGTSGLSWMTLGKNSSGENVIYAVTNQTSANRLLAITDKGSAALSTTVVLATAPTNTLFRGVDFSTFAPNAAPVAVDDTYAATEDSALVVNAASGVIANDTDDQPISGLSASVVSAPIPAQGTLSLSANGSFTFTPAANFSGAATFTYKVNDGSLDSNTATVTINVAAQNDAPTLAAIPNQTVDELVTLNFTAVGNDIDGPSLTYSLTGAPAGATINPTTGVFSWTPTEAQGAGVYNFSVVVSDGSLSDTKPVQVTVNEVNQNPTLAAVPDQTVNEGSLLTFGLSGSDLDLPANTPAATLTYSLTGAPSGMSVDANTGLVTWTPTEAQGPQVYSFTAVVTDGLGGSDSKPVQVTVAEVNAAPTLAPIGNQTVNELQTLAFVAAGSDTDNPAQTLTYGLVGAPLGATINPTSGAFSWTPAENQGPGSFTFDVTVTDGVATTSETITVTVNEVNVAPVWNSIVAQSATEGVLFSLDVSPFASDSDTLPILPNNLTFTKFAGPTALSVSPAGLVTWTPGELDGGTSPSVTVRVTDDGSPTLFSDVTFTINVAEANQAPTWATIPAQSASEHVAFSMSLSSFASDADDPANVLTYELVSGPSGLTVSGSGAVAWTPGETDGGTSPSVQVRVTDNGSPNLSADQTFTINVAETNSAPVLDAIGNQTVDEGTLLTITLGATDTDDPAQTLVYSSTTLPAGATLVGNVLTWTPSESQGPGDYPVTFTVNDGAGGTDSEAINIHVNEVNVAPTWTAIPTQTATEHVHFTLDLTQFASDVDLPANNLTYALGHRTSGITVSPAGLLEWTPTEYDGGTSMNVQIVVSDNGDPDLFANHTFTINVLEANAAPALDAIPNQSVVATNLLTFTAVGSDPDDIPANGLTYSLVAGPDPVPAGASINPTTGVFTWTPTAPQGPGVYDFKVRVTDDGINPSGLFAEQPVHIVVDASNVAPTANNASFTTDENTPVNTPVVATDPDLPAQTLSYTIVTGPTHGVLSGSAPNYVYTPFNHYAGSDSFTYKVNDGQADSNVATVSITVNDTIPMSIQVAGSSAPNAWGSPSWAGYRGNALTSLENTFGDDLGSRLTDPTAYDVVTTIPWSDNTATGWAFWMGNLSPVAPFDQELGHRLHFGVRVLGNGTRFSLAELEFDMNSSDPGNDMDFDGWFDGTDPFGVGPETYGPSRRGIDYGPDRVKGTMDDIVYNTDSTPAETEVDELIYVGVGNAWDATQEPGNTPAEQTESLRCYLEGLLSIAPINISTTYSIRDGGHSGPLLASGSATVTMVPTNVLPTANSQTVTVAEDDSVGITLVANDPDDATLTYTVVAGPAHGVLSGTGANRIYTPNANYNGSDSFTFKATDCVGDSNIATVTINVTPVNDDPVLGAIGNRTIDEMVPYSITLSSLDIDGGAPVYSATGLPSGASVTGDTFNWTPSEAQGPGNYVITFQVSDGAGGTDSETITIHVDEVNVAPTLDAIGDQTVDELTLVTFDANGADSDLPSNTLTYSLIGAPAGASIDSGTGEFTWTPTEAQGGQAYAFTVRISDGTLHADRAVTITVNEVNSAPTLDTISNQTVNELTPVTFTASASDTDDPANSLTFSLIGAPSGASINPTTGAFAWTPSEAQGPQAHTFKVRVTDNGSPALFTEQNVTITVNEVNVAPVANAQTVGVEVNSSVNITLSASDVDLPANTLTYTIVGSPAHGNLSVSGANVVYTPNLNYTGPDSFTFKANDGLVDSNIATVDINVSGITVTLNLQLQGFSAAGPTTRGMTMFLGGTAGGSNDPVEVTRDVVFDATGHAVVVFTPADGFSPDADLANYAISVKDNLHTLRKTVGLTWNGSGYAANATLVGGNLNRDNRIDIGDYVVYATRYGTTPGADSPLSLQLNANFRHGDISGNGVVSTEEFTFISAAFGTADDALVTRYGRDDVTIRTKISVADAIREAGRDAQWLDRNGDGWISMDEATRRR